MKAFSLAGTRVGVLLSDGTLKVKEGSISSTWVTEASGIQIVAISGNRIAGLANGVLNVKEGGLSATWVPVATNVHAFDIYTPDEWNGARARKTSSAWLWLSSLVGLANQLLQLQPPTSPTWY